MKKSQPRICIVGSSGHAGLVADAIEQSAQFEIAGFVDSIRPPGPTKTAYNILGSISDLPELVRRLDVEACVIGVGDNWNRSRLTQDVQRYVPGMSFPVIRHPGAQIARSARTDEGSLFLAGSIVNPGAFIGSFCYLGARSSVDHDNWIGSFGSVGPGVTTGGNVHIGQFSSCCLGVNIIHGIGIGEHSVIGAGSLVLHSIPDRVVAYGTPARVIRTREIGERYL